MRTVIQVTLRDIRMGVSGNPYRCPVAKAVKRASRKKDVGITPEYCRIGRWQTLLGERAQQFVKNFDARKPVKPFSFMLNIPKP